MACIPFRYIYPLPYPPLVLQSSRERDSVACGAMVCYVVYPMGVPWVARSAPCAMPSRVRVSIVTFCRLRHLCMMPILTPYNQMHDFLGTLGKSG